MFWIETISQYKITEHIPSDISDANPKSILKCLAIVQMLDIEMHVISAPSLHSPLLLPHKIHKGGSACLPGPHSREEVFFFFS